MKNESKTGLFFHNHQSPPVSERQKEVWKRNSYRLLDRYNAPLKVEVNHVIIVVSSFSKSSIFKAFSIRSRAGVFKFLLVEERFRKAPFSVGTSIPTD